jgi:hypothetical protein
MPKRDSGELDAEVNTISKLESTCVADIVFLQDECGETTKSFYHAEERFW